MRILPNFIHHMWFTALNGSGLAATTYGPNVLVARVGAEGARTAVQIEVTTDYPFGTQLRFNISSKAETTSNSKARERSEQKMAPVFPLLLRIPEWTTIDAMQVTIGGATHKLVPDEVCPHILSHDHHNAAQQFVIFCSVVCGHLCLSTSHLCAVPSNTETRLACAYCATGFARLWKTRYPRRMCG